MWVRYAVATVVGYAAFVLSLTVLARARRRVHPEPATGGHFERPSLFDVLDMGGEVFSAFDEPVGCLLAVVVLAAILIVTIVTGAAAPLAEAALDAVVVGAAWKRMQAQRTLFEDWLVVVRRTLYSVVLLVLVIAGGAAFMQASVPEATTLGDVLRGWW